MVVVVVSTTAVLVVVLLVVVDAGVVVVVVLLVVVVVLVLATQGPAPSLGSARMGTGALSMPPSVIVSVSSSASFRTTPPEPAWAALPAAKLKRRPAYADRSRATPSS